MPHAAPPQRSTDALFAGSVPELYDRCMVPLIFAPYADDMAARVAAARPRSVLEVAAGTGAVTRALSRTLGAGVEIVATDLNAPMLERAARVGTEHPVQWQQADASQLPFADASVDAVVCQFGVMFFPDKPRALAEALRVLRPGGTLFFNVWDRIEHNEFADVVTQLLAERFAANPPRFLARTPHGYFETDAIVADVRAAGFRAAPRIDTVAARSRAESAALPAMAYCQGTPLRGEIESQPGADLVEVTEACARALEARFGAGPVDGKIQALVVSVDA